MCSFVPSSEQKRRVLARGQQEAGYAWDHPAGLSPSEHCVALHSIHGCSVFQSWPGLQKPVLMPG